MYIKHTIRTWFDEFKDLFLKALTDSEFPILLSHLYHSITVDGKNGFGSVHV